MHAGIRDELHRKALSGKHCPELQGPSPHPGTVCPYHGPPAHSYAAGTCEMSEPGHVQPGLRLRSLFQQQRIDPPVGDEDKQSYGPPGCGGTFHHLRQ